MPTNWKNMKPTKKQPIVKSYWRKIKNQKISLKRKYTHKAIPPKSIKIVKIRKKETTNKKKRKKQWNNKKKEKQKQRSRPGIRKSTSSPFLHLIKSSPFHLTSSPIPQWSSLSSFLIFFWLYLVFSQWFSPSSVANLPWLSLSHSLIEMAIKSLSSCLSLSLVCLLFSHPQKTSSQLSQLSLVFHKNRLFKIVSTFQNIDKDCSPLLSSGFTPHSALFSSLSPWSASHKKFKLLWSFACRYHQCRILVIIADSKLSCKSIKMLQLFSDHQVCHWRQHQNVKICSHHQCIHTNSLSQIASQINAKYNSLDIPFSSTVSHANPLGAQAIKTIKVNVPHCRGKLNMKMKVMLCGFFHYIQARKWICKLSFFIFPHCFFHVYPNPIAAASDYSLAYAQSYFATQSIIFETCIAKNNFSFRLIHTLVCCRLVLHDKSHCWTQPPKPIETNAISSTFAFFPITCHYDQGLSTHFHPQNQSKPVKTNDFDIIFGFSHANTRIHPLTPNMANSYWRQPIALQSSRVIVKITNFNFFSRNPAILYIPRALVLASDTWPFYAQSLFTTQSSLFVTCTFPT